LIEAQYKCIELLLEGHKMKEIEDAIGYNRKTIWEWKTKNKLFIAEMDKRKRDITEFLSRSANRRFEKLQDTAIDVLEQLLKDSKNDNVRMETAKEVLNRNIGKIPNKLEVSEKEYTEENNTELFEGLGKWDEDTKE
jgi:ribosomal protein L31E